MNNSTTPRKGASSSLSGKGKASPKSQTYRIPKGFTGAGKFTTRQALEDYYLPELKARQKAEQLERKRKHDRETKKATRDRRAKIMAKADGVKVSKEELQSTLKKRGMQTKSSLKEKTRYRWLGVFKVHGGEEYVKKAMATAGSDPRRAKITRNEDGSYTGIFTNYFQVGTPAQAEEFLAAHIQQAQDEYARGGAVAHYVGAAWQPALVKRGGK